MNRRELYEIEQKLRDKTPFFPDVSRKHPASSSDDSTYDGPFACTATTTDDDPALQAVDIAEGDFISGAGTMVIEAQEKLAVDVSQTGTLYVYFYVYSKVYADGERATYGK